MAGWSMNVHDIMTKHDHITTGFFNWGWWELWMEQSIEADVVCLIVSWMEGGIFLTRPKREDLAIVPFAVALRASGSERLLDRRSRYANLWTLQT